MNETENERETEAVALGLDLVILFGRVGVLVRRGWMAIDRIGQERGQPRPPAARIQVREALRVCAMAMIIIRIRACNA